MTRTVFAMAVAALLSLAVLGVSQAGPIVPLSGVVAADQSDVTPVYWRYHHRYYHHHWYRHHRHCWRGYYGHVHCRW